MARYQHPRENALKVGKTAPRAKLYFYEPGTTTPKNTTDASGTPLTNPVTADENGIFEAIYGEGLYKVVKKDNTDATLWTEDNIAFSLTEADAVSAVDVIDVNGTDSLYAITGAFDDQQISVASYYEADSPDGGGGFFVWDSVSALADNACTVVLPTGHVGAGRWIRQVHGHITPEMAGCVGDGTTDDTDNLQVALDTGYDVGLLSTYAHSYNELQEGQTVFAIAPGAGIKQVAGLTYTNGSQQATGGYGLSAATGITWCKVSGIEYDGNSTASTDYAANYTNLDSGGDIIKGRIKGGGGLWFSTVDGDGNDTKTSPKWVYIENCYVHDCTRNCIFMSDSDGGLLVNNTVCENSNIDKLIYDDTGKFSQFSNIQLRGFWYESAVVSSGANWNNILFRDIAANPITTAAGRDLHPRQLVDDRTDTAGSTWSNVIAIGDFELLDDVDVTPRLFEARADNVTISGFKATNTNLTNYALYGFITRGTSGSPGQVDGLTVDHVDFVNMPGSFQPFVHDPENYGGNLDGCRLTDVNVIYYDGAIQLDAALFWFRGANVRHFTASDIWVYSRGFAEGGPHRLFDDATTNAFERVVFERVDASVTLENSAEPWTLSGNQEDVHINSCWLNNTVPIGTNANEIHVSNLRLTNDKPYNVIGLQFEEATTDATATTIWTSPPAPLNGLISITVSVYVTNAAASNRLIQYKRSYWYRNAGSGGAALDSTSDIHADVATASVPPGISFAQNGSNVNLIDVIVTGEAATNYEWRVTLDCEYLQHS